MKVLAALVSVLLAAVPATAAVPPAPDAADPIAVGTVLRLYAERSRDTRRSIIHTSVVTGAVLLTTGIILDKRADEVSQSVGVGLIAGGAAPLLFSLMLARPSGIEKVSAHHDVLVSSGVDAGTIQQVTEDEWARAAESAHRQRVIAGGVEVVLGGALTAAGTYLLLARPMWGMSRNGQYEVASFLVGPGVPVFSLGARSLTVDSLEETSWKAYSALLDKARPAPPPATFGFVPARGGLLAAMSMALW